MKLTSIYIGEIDDRYKPLIWLTSVDANYGIWWSIPAGSMRGENQNDFY